MNYKNFIVFEDFLINYFSHIKKYLNFIFIFIKNYSFLKKYVIYYDCKLDFKIIKKI